MVHVDTNENFVCSKEKSILNGMMSVLSNTCVDGMGTALSCLMLSQVHIRGGGSHVALVIICFTMYHITETKMMLYAVMVLAIIFITPNTSVPGRQNKSDFLYAESFQSFLGLMKILEEMG